MLVNGPELVRALHNNADVAGGQMVAALYGQRGPGSTVILTYPWYESLWFTRATAWLPDAREVWVLGPFVFTGLAIAGLGWTASRLFGAWAGAMTAVILVCSSSALRIVTFTLNWHGAPVVHAVLLCVVLVLVIRYSGRLSTPALVGVGAAVATITALIVSDELSLVIAIVPFAGTALLMWWRTGLGAERRVAIFAVATMAAAIAGGQAAAHAMSDAGVIEIPGFRICFTDYTQLSDNLEILVVALAALGSGTFFTRALDAGGIGRFTLAVLTLGAAVLVLRRLWNAAPRVVERARAAGPEGVARDAYLVFWSLALVGILVAFVFLDVSWDVISSRYLTGGFFALAALVPPLLGVRPRARLVVAAGIGLYAALTLGFHVAKGVGTWSDGVDLGAPTDQLVHFARANGLEVGYGGYRDAPVVTWLADERVKVFPVSPCGTRLCPYGAQAISTWYRPRRRVRTFLVAHPLAKGRLSLKAPYARAGRPLEVRRFGSLTVYVYDHDLAADLGPGPNRHAPGVPCGIPNRLHRPSF